MPAATYAPIPGGPLKTVEACPSPPRRWLTAEFLLYYLVIVYAAQAALREAYRLSTAGHDSYQKYEHLLDKGWLFGRTIVCL